MHKGKDKDATFHVRYARSEQALRDSGGKRLNIRLSGDGVQHLESIMTREGLETQTEAVEYALKREVSRRR